MIGLSTFLNTFFEEDLLRNQIHQHHRDNKPSDYFEVDKTHDMHLQGETSFKQEVYQICEDNMKSAKHNGEDRFKDSPKDCSHIIALASAITVALCSAAYRILLTAETTCIKKRTIELSCKVFGNQQLVWKGLVNTLT